MWRENHGTDRCNRPPAKTSEGRIRFRHGATPIISIDDQHLREKSEARYQTSREHSTLNIQRSIEQMAIKNLKSAEKTRGVTYVEAGFRGIFGYYRAASDARA